MRHSSPGSVWHAPCTVDGRVYEARAAREASTTTFEGAQVVAPNGMLLADKLVNWTLHDTLRRIDINVSTGFAVSPQQTIDLLVGIARNVQGISMSPAPAAILTGLAPGQLDFNLRA